MNLRIVSVSGEDARAFSWSRLRRALPRLAEAEAGIKGWEGGVSDPRLAMVSSFRLPRRFPPSSMSSRATTASTSTPITRRPIGN